MKFLIKSSVSDMDLTPLNVNKLVFEKKEADRRSKTMFKKVHFPKYDWKMLA